MKTCYSKSSIEVTGCPDWTLLIAPVPPFPTIVQDPGYTASFTPMAGDMHIFTATATDPVPATGFGNASNKAALAGYAGPACNCNLHLNWTQGADNTGAGATVTITTDQGGPVVTVLTVNITNNASFSTDFPFSIPSGTVVPYNITVEVGLQTQAVFLASTYTLAGTITNV